MKQEVARKLINITEHGYDIISEEFAGTRSYIWPIMKYFKKNYVGEGSRILDVGCGNARLFELFQDGDFKYVGTDISKGVLNVAEKKWHEKGVDLELIPTDVTKRLPFKENSFDAVFLIAVLNHIPSHDLRLKALENIYDVLAPKGYIFITNFNLWNFSASRKGILKYTIKRLKTQDSDWYEEFGFHKKDIGFQDVITEWKGGDKHAHLYYRAFTRGEMKKLAKESNYRVLKNFYEADSRKVPFYKGRNLVTVLRKI